MTSATSAATISLNLLGLGLIHFAWQAAIIALATGALLRLTQTSRPQVRYVICYAALLLMIVAPTLTVLLTSHVTVHDTLATIRLASPSTRTTDVSWNGQFIGTHYRQEQERLFILSPLVSRYLPYATTCWLVGVFFSALYHLMGFARLRHLARCSPELLDPAWASRVRRVGAKLGVSRTIRVVASVRTLTPAVIGCLKPVILLPASFLTGMNETFLEALLLHELAHLQRLDYVFNLLQIAIEILGFFHPAVWWLSRRIREEREQCCDDIAVAATGDRLSYAKALIYLEEQRFATAVALAANGGNLFHRVARILGQRPATSSFVNAGGLAVVSLFMILLTAFTWRAAGNVWPVRADDEAAILHHISSHLVAYYPLDGNANDESGYDQHGIIRGAVACPDRNGRPDHALSFDGKKSIVVISSTKAVDSCVSFTISCWICPRRCGKYESWIGKPSGKGTKKSVWRMGFGEAQTAEWGLTEWRPNGGMGIWNDYWVEKGELPLNRWSHVTAVADQKMHVVRLYLNGTQVAAIDGLVPPKNTDGPLAIGFQGDDFLYFDGNVDDVRIYNTPLDDQEVAALFAMN